MPASSATEPLLPPGWDCRVVLNETAEGAYAGKAELRFQGVQRCVLLIAQQPTREAALGRVKLKAESFVAEWSNRPHTGDTQAGEL